MPAVCRCCMLCSRFPSSQRGRRRSCPLSTGRNHPASQPCICPTSEPELTQTQTRSHATQNCQTLHREPLTRQCSRLTRRVPKGRCSGLQGFVPGFLQIRDTSCMWLLVSTALHVRAANFPKLPNDCLGFRFQQELGTSTKDFLASWIKGSQKPHAMSHCIRSCSDPRAPKPFCTRACGNCLVS